MSTFDQHGDERDPGAGQSAAEAPADATATVALRIFGVDFQVRCAREDVDDLNAVAVDLDSRMRHIHATSHVATTDRLAVMAALNIGRENLQHRQRAEHANRELARLLERTGDALDRHQAASKAESSEAAPRSET